MAFSIPLAEPFKSNPNDPDFSIRILRIDDTVVSQKFYHPEHGPEPHPIEGCCEGTSPHPDAVQGCSVSIRKVGNSICWIPPAGDILGIEVTPEDDLGPALPVVRRSPIWFRRAEYESFLSSLALSPQEQLGRIRPMSLEESDRVLRHAFLGAIEHRPGLPAWKEIKDLVLATEFRPADSPFNAFCLQAAEARMHGATIVEVIGEPEGMDLHLVEHLDREGFPEFEALAFRIRGEALETWAPVGNGCWGRLAF